MIRLVRAQMYFDQGADHTNWSGGRQRQAEIGSDGSSGRRSTPPEPSIDPELADYYANLEVPICFGTSYRP